MKNLSSDQLASYQRDGILALQDVFDNFDLEQLQAESARLWEIMALDQSNRRIQWRKRVDGGKTSDRIDPVLDISPLFEELANDPGITSMAGQLLQCRQPEIFKSKLISKWPQTTGYAMHQDYTYWPGLGDASPHDFVTALVALDRFAAKSGTLELFPGLHHARLAPPANNPSDVDEREIDLSTVVLAILNPGDVVFFHSMTPHRSGPNLSQNDRQSLFFTYVQPGHDDLNRHYYAQRADDFMEPE